MAAAEEADTIPIAPDTRAAFRAGGVLEAFEAMAPSCRREYQRWIEEAKRAATRERRIAEAVTMIAAGRKGPR